VSRVSRTSLSAHCTRPHLHHATPHPPAVVSSVPPSAPPPPSLLLLLSRPRRCRWL